MQKNRLVPKTDRIAALDIGSSKIACFIARVTDEGRPHVTGIGYHVSRGIRGGVITDMEAAATAIRAAVHSAEQMAGETIDSVIVNLSGGYPTSQTVAVEVQLNGHEVGDNDLRRVLGESRHYEPGPDRRLIHSIPVSFSIDGNRGIRDPRGMFGESLGVNLHLISAAAGAVRNLTNCVAKCRLDIRALVISPYAAGLASLVDDEIDLGVTVIDMGAGATTLAVFFDGQVIYTDAIPVGGGHVTSDIARGLTTPIAQAERMKTLYGSCLTSPLDEREIIEVPQVGEDDATITSRVPKSILVGIIQPRLEETLELVRARLEASGFDKVAGRRVVLTGGASQLTGVRELAALVLDKQVRIGRPIRIGGLAEATSGPAFATCAGLLNYMLRAEPEEHSVNDIPAIPAGVIGRIGHWFRENF